MMSDVIHTSNVIAFLALSQAYNGCAELQLYIAHKIEIFDDQAEVIL